MRSLRLACFLLASCALLAQPSSTSRITFEQRWPASNPQWFEIVIHPDGSAKYRSLPHQESNSSADDPAAEPYECSFTLSPRSQQLVFAAAPKLSGFQSSLDKIKVAYTGSKTLRYEDGAGGSSFISYNYSSSPELSGVTALMQAISETIERSQTLLFQARFNKLALDSTLKDAETLLSPGRLPEPQLLEPTLRRIADDPTIMNIARQRARQILQAPQMKKNK